MDCGATTTPRWYRLSQMLPWESTVLLVTLQLLMSCRMDGSTASRTSSVAGSKSSSPPFLSPTRKVRPSPGEAWRLKRMVVAVVAAARFPAAFRMSPEPALQ